MSLDYVGTIHLDSNVVETDDGSSINSLAHFRTTLASPLDFTSDEYEVGLVNMTYTNTWYNVGKNEYVALARDQGTIEYVVPLIEGKYNTVYEILAMINNVLANMTSTEYSYLFRELLKHDSPHIPICLDRDCVILSVADSYDPQRIIVPLPHTYIAPKLDLDKASGMLKLEIGSITVEFNQPTHVIPMFSVATAELLGLPYALHEPSSGMYIDCETALCPSTARSYQEKTQEIIYKAVAPVDRTAGIGCLFVYTNLIRHHPVGNTESQLLRVIPVPNGSTFGDIVTEEFKSPLFYPLLHTHITSIEIKICDGSNQLIKFNSGRVIIVLEVRRRNNGTLL